MRQGFPAATNVEILPLKSLLRYENDCFKIEQHKHQKIISSKTRS